MGEMGRKFYLLGELWEILPLFLFLVFFKLKYYDFSSHMERIFKKDLIYVSIFKKNNKIIFGAFSYRWF